MTYLKKVIEILRSVPSRTADIALGKEELDPRIYSYHNHSALEDLKERFQNVRMTQYADGSVKYECKGYWCSCGDGTSNPSGMCDTCEMLKTEKVDNSDAT